MVGAVIYVRVSDPRQVVNLSLGTQLRACDEYCVREGFQVLERFTEEGESAKTADRTELQRLFQFCRSNKGKVHFVVVYSLSRFAREKFDHFALRAHLHPLGSIGFRAFCRAEWWRSVRISGSSPSFLSVPSSGASPAVAV